MENIDKNYVIEVKFSKLPEMVEVVRYIREYIILPWWAFFVGLTVFVALCWFANREIKKYRTRKELEERGL